MKKMFLLKKVRESRDSRKNFKNVYCNKKKVVGKVKINLKEMKVFDFIFKI